MKLKVKNLWLFLKLSLDIQISGSNAFGFVLGGYRIRAIYWISLYNIIEFEKKEWTVGKNAIGVELDISLEPENLNSMPGFQVSWP
ncbi:hypothetical protein BOTCAL_0021g00150 [Botryotinia calthae]|uniref:Uncharacterized protein n=1 Tax=Botryotinia calthae TaxID=38488 RepID=A0A4Y8DEM1_9HELO|nr:hypothetical protein BOTCAL_0021g00150 [Botryotinia calthae]